MFLKMNIHLPLLLIILAARNVRLFKFTSRAFQINVFSSALLVQRNLGFTNPSFNLKTLRSEDETGQDVSIKYLTDMSLPIKTILQLVKTFCSSVTAQKTADSSCAELMNKFHDYDYSLEEAKEYFEWGLVGITHRQSWHVCRKVIWKTLKDDKDFNLYRCRYSCDLRDNTTEAHFEIYTDWFNSIEGPKTCSCLTVKHLGFIFQSYLQRNNKVLDKNTEILKRIFDEICRPTSGIRWQDDQYIPLNKLVQSSDNTYTIDEILLVLKHPISLLDWFDPTIKSIDIIGLINRSLISDPSGPKLSIEDAQSFAIHILKLSMTTKYHKEFISILYSFLNYRNEHLVAFLNDLMPFLLLLKDHSKSTMQLDTEFHIAALKDIIPFFNDHWKPNLE